MYKIDDNPTLIPAQGRITYKKYESGLHNLNVAQVTAPTNTKGHSDKRTNAVVTTIFSINVLPYNNINKIARELQYKLNFRRVTTIVNYITYTFSFIYNPNGA